jgi:transcriptional regulator with XRE-family HTH domain
MLTKAQLAQLRRSPAGRGNRVLSARKLANLTQVQLSEMSGIEQARISKIERGSGVSLTTAHDLAAALGCTVDDLFPRVQAVA